MASVDLEIKVSSEKAVSSIKKFGKAATNTFDGINSTITATKALFAGVVAFAVGKKLIGGFSDIIAAGQEADDAITQLNSSLVLAGDYSAEASKDMQDFATQMEGASKFGDDLVLSQISVAKTFGATNEAAKKVVKASIEVASATGKSLEDVTAALSKSLSGDTAGMRELLKIAPEIKQLTKIQLENGEAADILLKRFGGAAAAQLNTYSGAMAALTNAQGNFNDALGMTITQNPAVIALLKVISNVYKNLTKLVEDNKESIAELITRGITNLIDALPRAVQALRILSESFYAIKFSTYDATSNVLSFAKSFLKFKPINVILNSIIDTLQTLNLRLLQASSYSLKFFAFFAKAGGWVEDDGKRIQAAIDILEQAIKIRSDSLDLQKDNFNSLTNELETLSDASSDIASKSAKDFESVDEKLKKLQQSAVKVGDQFKKTLAEVSAPKLPDAIKVPTGFFDKLKSAWSEFVSYASQEFSKAIDFKTMGEGIAGAVSNGKKAAEELSAKIIGGVAEAVGRSFGLPGLGAFFEPLAKASAAGPEEVRKQAKIFGEEMGKMIPSMVEGIIIAIPEIVTALVDSLIMQGGLVRIIDALIVLLPRTAVGIGKALVIAVGAVASQVVGLFMIPFTEALRRIFTSIAENLSFTGLINNLNSIFGKTEWPWFSQLREILSGATVSWLADLQNALTTEPWWIEKLREVLNSVSAGGFRVGGTVGQIANTAKDFFGMAKGGVVPPGFPNDTYPAMLTSGERVLPADQPQTDGMSNVLLAKIIDLLSQPIQVSTTAEVNGKTLADIILNLNRTSARMA